VCTLTLSRSYWLLANCAELLICDRQSRHTPVVRSNYVVRAVMQKDSSPPPVLGVPGEQGRR